MVGIGGIGDLVIYFFTLFFSLSIGLTFFWLGIIHSLEKKWRTAWRFFAIAFFLCVILVGFIIWLSPITRLGSAPLMNYSVVFTITEDRTFSGLPGGRIQTYEGITEHQIWGNLDLNITLPDGKRIKGSSERLTVFTVEDRIVSLQTSFKPIVETENLDYWVDGGKFIKYYSDYIERVDRGTYSLEIFTIDVDKLYLTLQIPADAGWIKQKP